MPIILYLDVIKDKWQGSIISVIFWASKPGKQPM
jgi:hypothetical protein